MSTATARGGSPWRLAWRQALRDLAAGEVRLLIAALALAVASVTTISFLTDRAERALALEANRLLGGDAVLRADAPLAPELRALADRPGLTAGRAPTAGSSSTDPGADGVGARRAQPIRTSTRRFHR